MSFCEKICKKYFDDCCKNGLKAIKKSDRKYIIFDKSKFSINCSLDIDNCLHQAEPNANRWDYAISFENKLFFIEIHPKKEKEVDTVFKKADWLKDLLQKIDFYEYYEKLNVLYWIFHSGGKLLGTTSKKLVLRKIVQKNFVNLNKDIPSAELKK